jgi:predicted metal-dependent phosphoesterase TrpH
LDAVEAHNAGVITPMSNRLARRLGRRLGMAVTGSSDAHTLGAVGSGRTRFPGRTADDLRAALEGRHTIAEGGPWPLSEYLAIVRALPHWISPGARVPVPDADAELV